MDIRTYILNAFPGKSFSSSGKINACCPFHDDSHPSFSINEKGQFICGSQSCGVRGGFALFYKLTENIDNWKQVYEDIKEGELNPEFNTKSLFSTDSAAKTANTNTFPDASCYEPLGELEYLTKRGFTTNDMQRLYQAYSLLYGTDGKHEGVYLQDTIIAPIFNLKGEYQTFQVRYLNPNSKMRWNNPEGSPLQDLLYGGWLVNSQTSALWVVEGASDVWNLFKMGHTAVGLFTKEATASQLQDLLTLGRKYDPDFIIALDGDTHNQDRGFGRDYPAKIHKELLAFGLRSKIIYLRGEEDAGSLSREQVERYLLGGTDEASESGGSLRDPVTWNQSW